MWCDGNHTLHDKPIISYTSKSFLIYDKLYTSVAFCFFNFFSEKGIPKKDGMPSLRYILENIS